MSVAVGGIQVTTLLLANIGTWIWMSDGQLKMVGGTVSSAETDCVNNVHSIERSIDQFAGVISNFHFYKGIVCY